MKQAMTLADARATFKSEVIPTLRHRDKHAVRQAWAEYIDGLHRARKITDRQVQTWDLPDNFGVARKRNSKPFYVIARDSLFSGNGPYEGKISMFAIEAATKAEAARAKENMLARDEMHEVRIVARLPRETQTLAVKVVPYESAKGSNWFVVDAEVRAKNKMMAPVRALRALRDKIERNVSEYAGSDAAQRATEAFIIVAPLRDAKGYREECRDGLIEDGQSERDIANTMKGGVPALFLKVNEVADSYGYEGDLCVASRSRSGKLDGTTHCGRVVFVHRPDVDFSKAMAVDTNMELYAPSIAAKALEAVYSGHGDSRDPSYSARRR